MLRIAGQGISTWQSWLAPLMFPMMRRYLKRHLDISPENVDRGMERVHKHFSRVARQLSDGRPFLCGEQFAAADLSFACMKHTAGRLALRLFEQQRKANPFH